MANAEPPKSYTVRTGSLEEKQYHAGEQGASRKTYCEGAGRIARGGPAPASVQAEALVPHDFEDTSSAERLGVGLALDLEHVEGQEDDLADTDQTRRSKRHVRRLLSRQAGEAGLSMRTFRRWSA